MDFEKSVETIDNFWTVYEVSPGFMGVIFYGAQDILRKFHRR
jgi:hypothetical protein